jgi:formylglycine-generating enzyme required for sulfatase activity
VVRKTAPSPAPTCPRRFSVRVGRGDLLVALQHASSPSERESVAALCGFAAKPPSITASQDASSQPSEKTDLSSPLPDARPVQPGVLRILRAAAYRHKDLPPPSLPEEIGSEPIRLEELRSKPYVCKPQVLQPWSRLWPYLHRILGRFEPGTALDLSRLVDRMARLRPVQRLPRRLHLAWAPRVHILIDGMAPMDPFQPDVEILLDRLSRLRGLQGLHRRVLPFGPNELAAAVDPASWEVKSPAALAPGDPVLVLGDLGCLNGDGQRQLAWYRFGRKVRSQRAVPLALLPCPRDRWTVPLCMIWKSSLWDRRGRCPLGGRGLFPTSSGLADSRRAVLLEALLRAASVFVRIEAPLLRELRLSLPAADAGIEYDFWNHPEVAHTPTGCALRFEHAAKRREEFALASDPLVVPLKELVPDLLRRHHGDHGRCVWAREMMNAKASELAVTAAEVTEAREIRHRANRARLEEILTTAAEIAPSDRYGLGALTLRDVARTPPKQLAQEPELAAACALECLAHSGSTLVPVGMEMDAYWRTIRFVTETPTVDILWNVRQAGSVVQLRPTHHPSSRAPLGPSLGFLPARAQEVIVDLAKEDQCSRTGLKLTVDPPPTCAIGQARRVHLRSDRGELELEMAEPPRWATRFGWDRRGMVADFAVKGVLFTLRWIPPGEFVMGSPDDEPGRWEDEGPQHRVTIGRGFWLGETPVTQGQYAAVTGQRPSHFQHAGDRAPVEQVSWDECQAFCEKLAGLVPDFDSNSAFRLPSEAEWEYACRAGTTGALYTGPLTIRGERDGPELDAIAWYGGNSGVEYDGGLDSSDWKEKQYDHQRAGTHPVRQKRPNPWGLYDMLGNVWEWCEDGWHNSYNDAPTDGAAWAAEGSRRVNRGGSWASGARRCRCASRFDWGRGFRYDGLGFRLVLASKGREDVGPFS